MAGLEDWTGEPQEVKTVGAIHREEDLRIANRQKLSQTPISQYNEWEANQEHKRQDILKILAKQDARKDIANDELSNPSPESAIEGIRALMMTMNNTLSIH